MPLCTILIVSSRWFSSDLGGTEPVPGILQLPRLDAPVPAVLLLHGFTSHKADMAALIGRALYLRGVASLAIDLPMHGERVGAPSNLPIGNPLALVTTWHLALREAGLAISHLAGLRGVDRNRIAIAGYSLGASLSVCVAAKDPRICAVALTAGGDLPSVIPFIPLVRTIVDPMRRRATSLGTAVAADERQTRSPNSPRGGEHTVRRGARAERAALVRRRALAAAVRDGRRCRMARQPARSTSIGAVFAARRAGR